MPRFHIKNDRLFTIDLIINFFDNKDFKYRIKKSERSIVNERYLKVYQNYCYFRKEYLIGKKLGEGRQAVVYGLRHTKNKVLKLYKTSHSFEKEKSHYKKLVDLGLEKIIPYMEFHDQYSIVDRANKFRYEHNDKMSKKLKSIITDKMRENFGIINDKIVVVDLGELDLKTVKQNLDDLKKLYHS